MADESRDAASFFGRTPSEAADLEVHIQRSEGNFEERAVRQLLKHFRIDPKGWDVREKMGERFRFSIFDSVYPRFPVRLGTRRLVAKRLQAEKRRKSDLAFHELKAITLFKPDEFRKTQVFKEWENLKDDQSLDGRSVGLIFQCVSTLFVVHNWDYFNAPGIRLQWRAEDGSTLTVELFDTFLASVGDFGWTPY